MMKIIDTELIEDYLAWKRVKESDPYNYTPQQFAKETEGLMAIELLAQVREAFIDYEAKPEKLRDALFDILYPPMITGEQK